MSPTGIVCTAGKYQRILPLGNEDVVQVVAEVWASHLLQTCLIHSTDFWWPVKCTWAVPPVIRPALGTINQSLMSKHESMRGVWCNLWL